MNLISTSNYISTNVISKDTTYLGHEVISDVVSGRWSFLLGSHYALLPERKLIYLGKIYLRLPEVNLSLVSFSPGEKVTLRKTTSTGIY